MVQVADFKGEIARMGQQIDVHDGISSNTFVAALPIVQRKWEIGLPLVIVSRLENILDAAREKSVKQEPVLTEHPINVRLLRPEEKLNVPYPVATLGLETGMMLERAMR